MKNQLFLVAEVASLVLLLSYGCSKYQKAPQSAPEVAVNVSQLQPDELVRLYYESFDRKDYATMYALISDGFKQLEPTAKNYELFAAEMDKYFNNGKGVQVVEVNKPDISGDSAVVSYKILLQLNTGDREFESAFTLRKRHNGWKLIHPYGQNVDTS